MSDDPVTALSPQDMRDLLESARELGRHSHLEDVLQCLMARAGEMTGSPDISIILCHDDRASLYVAAAVGARADWVLATFGRHAAKSIPLHGSKAGEVFTSGRSLVVNRVDDHFRGVDEETRSPTESMVCVPLDYGEGTLGVMQILNKPGGGYDQRDRLVLEHLAAQAAGAIVHAQLLESAIAHSGCYLEVTGATRMMEIMHELSRPAHLENLTVLFADMRGFTQLCQSLGSPVEIQDKLNDFLSMLAEEVLAAEGMVNKYLGDGLMALFRHDDHAQRAVDAAFRIAARFDGLKSAWNDTSSVQLDFLDIGVGIATGEAMLGGIGSERVRDFTAIGTVTNLAAALVKEARDGRRILANHLTRTLAGQGVEAEAMTDYLLQKPGQTLGVKHKCYELRKSPQQPPPRVFISHSHADRQFVEERIVAPLRELGIATWYAPEEIQKASLWPAQIRKGLARCSCMLVVVSANSAGSDWVRLEVDLAFGLKSMMHRVIPLCLDDTAPHRVNDYLLAVHGINVPNSPGFVDEIVSFARESTAGG